MPILDDEDDKTLLGNEANTLVSAQDYDRLFATTALNADEFINADDPNTNKAGVFGAIAQNTIELPASMSEANLGKEFYFNGAMDVSRQSGISAIAVFNPLLGSLLGSANSKLGSVLADSETAMKIVTAREKRRNRLEGMGYDLSSTGAQIGGAVAQGLTFATTAGIGGAPAATALLAGQAAVSGAEKYIDVLASTGNTQLAFARGAGSAVLSYATEKIGMDAITASFTPLLRKNIGTVFARAITGAVGEGGEEVIQSFGEQGMDIAIGEQDAIDFQQVGLSGVFGMIGGGAGGLAYASMFRRKLLRSLDNTAQASGVKLTPEQRSQAVDEVMAGASIGFTDLVLQHAGVDQSMVDAITKRRQRVMGMPEMMEEGISQEDVKLMMAARDRYTSAVDEVMSQQDGGTVQPQNAAEVTMRLKTIEDDATALMRTYAGLQADKDVSNDTIKALDERVTDLLKEQGANEAQIQELKARLAEESTPELAVENKQLKAESKRIAQELASTLKEHKASGKTDVKLSDRIDELVEQYEDLVVERREVAQGKQTQGRIRTTMAKVRAARMKDLSERLRAMRTARSATKAEIASVTNGLRRLIRSARLPVETKNEMVAKLKAGITFEDVFTLYPRIQQAIDDALLDMKKNAAFAQLYRGIDMLKKSAFEADRKYAEQLSKAVRSGTIPTQSFGTRRDAILKQAVLATQGSPLYDANGIADLAADVQMLTAEARGKETAIAEMNAKKQQTLMEMTARALRGRAKETSANRIKGDSAEQKDVMRLGASMSDLSRDLMFLSPEIAKTFSIHEPYTVFVQNMAQAEERVQSALKKRGKHWAKKHDYDKADEHEDVAFESTDDKGNPILMRTTPTKARYLYAITRNKKTATDLIKSGQLTENGIREIEDWVNLPENIEHKTLVEDMAKIQQEYFPRIQAMMRELFPTADFSAVSEYFMTRRILDPDINADFYDLVFGSATKDSEINISSALKKRTGGSHKFKILGDVQATQQYIQNMEHFLAYGRYVQNLKRYLANNKEQIVGTLGNKFFNALETEVNFYRDGAKIRNAAFSAHDLMQKTLSNSARALTRGATQLPKQLVGMYTSTANPIELTNNIPLVMAYVAGDTEVDPLLKTIGSTAKVKERYGHNDSFSITTTSIGMPSKTTEGSILKQKINHLTAFFPRTGDKLAYMNVAYTKAKELIKGGMNETDAIAQGINEAEMSQTTQNPGRTALPVLTGKNDQIMTSVYSLSQTTFQIFNRYMTEVESAAILWKRGQKAKALKQFGEVAAKWHGLVPMTYVAMASGMTASTAEYLAKMLVGPVGDTPVVGDIFNALYNLFARFIEKASEDEDGEKTVDLTGALKAAAGNRDLISSMVDSTSKAFSRMVDATNDEDYVKGIIAGVEAATIITALSTGIPTQELAKVAGSVYDNVEAGADATNGLYPWMLALSGYSRNRVKKAREAE